jgi:dihydroorotase
VDPGTHTNKVQDILIQDGVIKKVTGRITPVPDRVEVIDAQGLIVCPGLLDMHVHLREPGREDEETIESGCRAAAAGGITGVACMPNTEPVTDNQEGVKFILKRAEGQAARVYPIGAITKKRQGKELAEIGDMVEAGAVAVSDDGDWIADGTLMRRALEYTRIFRIPVISHCEDKTFVPRGCMNEGKVSTTLGLPGMSRLAEDTAVARDIAIAAFTQGRLHIAHVSTAGAVKLIREAKKQGVAVTAESAPHYFCLDDSMVRSFNTSYKMNPPLRTREDIREIKKGLADGTIDCIVSDHAPHAPEEKETEFDAAPFGITGLETLVSLCLQELVAKKVLTLAQLVDKLTYQPARVLNIKKDKIIPGATADLALIDPRKKWTVSRDTTASKCLNTPYLGKTLTGRAVRTFLGK